MTVMETTRGTPGGRSLSFSQFRQVVRRHRPSDLLPLLGHIACRLPGPPINLSVAREVAPWAIPLIARESVLWGNEHRKAGITSVELQELFTAFNDIYEDRGEPNSNKLHAILTRMAYEQFPYQESIFEEVTRTHALLLEGLQHITPEVLSEKAWDSILGMPLSEAIGATFFLHVAAMRNGGWFRPEFLGSPGLEQIFEAWPRSAILARAEHLSYDFSDFKAAYNAVASPPAGYERYAFNPLTSRPFLRMPGGAYLAPQPHLILRTITPGSLYYAGMHAFGEAFGHDFGHLTERYVGEQLLTIDGAQVLPEVDFGPKRSRKKSIDWFLVLPSVVVLVEAKSARFGLRDRFAAPGFEDRITAHLTKAIEELERTCAAIAASDSAFSAIPTDRPIIGLIVTAEPYYHANTPLVRSLVPTPPIPTLSAALRELEQLVTLSPTDIEEQLLGIVGDADRSTWMLGRAINTTHEGRNPILDRAWRSYPWPIADEAPGETVGAPPPQPEADQMP